MQAFHTVELWNPTSPVHKDRGSGTGLADIWTNNYLQYDAQEAHSIKNHLGEMPYRVCFASCHQKFPCLVLPLNTPMLLQHGFVIKYFCCPPTVSCKSTTFGGDLVKKITHKH